MGNLIIDSMNTVNLRWFISRDVRIYTVFQPPKKAGKAKSPKLSKADKERLKKEELEKKAREEGVVTSNVLIVRICTQVYIILDEVSPSLTWLRYYFIPCKSKQTG